MAKILLADDHPHTVRLLQRCLQDGGYTLLTAGDGAEALEVLQAERPDLVILDVVMPRVDGFRVLSRIRADPALRDTLVVMLTAKAEPEEMALGLDIGADCYLTKPFRPTEVAALVRRLLETRQPASGSPELRPVA
jgi:DNA-binding response OmpR family regulator